MVKARRTSCILKPTEFRRFITSGGQLRCVLAMRPYLKIDGLNFLIAPSHPQEKTSFIQQVKNGPVAGDGHHAIDQGFIGLP